MNKYLTVSKVLKDSVALYRAHFLNMTVLIAAVLVPYGYLNTREELPEVVNIIMPVFMVLVLVVEIVSKKLASTSYLYFDFIFILEIKKSIKKLLPFILISLVGLIITFIGFSVFVLPGIFAVLFFNILKVHFIVNDKLIKDSILDVINLLKKGNFFKTLQIYMIPLTLQVLLSVLSNSIINIETLEEDLIRMFPYLIGLLILVFPISMCFNTSLYFNLVKENQLNSAD